MKTFYKLPLYNLLCFASFEFEKLVKNGVPPQLYPYISWPLRIMMVVDLPVPVFPQKMTELLEISLTLMCF